MCSLAALTEAKEPPLPPDTAAGTDVTGDVTGDADGDIRVTGGGDGAADRRRQVPALPYI